VQAYKDGVDEIDQRGAFPKEMARADRAIHYQSFALQALVTLAGFAERQGVPLYRANRSEAGRRGHCSRLVTGRTTTGSDSD